MDYSALERQLESETIALNRWLYEEGVGLPVDDRGYAAHADALARLAGQLLEHSRAPGLRYFALENWSEARRVPLDYRVVEARDQHLAASDFESSEGPLTWRNWKAFERETDDAHTLAAAFEWMVEQSAELLPALEARLARVRADFAAHGLTPLHTYAWREATTPEALHGLLLQVGQACREPFRRALNVLSEAVFGRPAGPPEIRALYLNRMYEPNAHYFAAETAVPQTQAAFREIGFDLAHIPVDVESRPRKYAGAFCFPIAVPHDVRVSVRMASAHHLVDMLYHEFGHAAHFSGIRADLPFVERYWIHSGVHETFSTLFEFLLGEPEFLQQQFRFAEAVVQRLLAFHRFKCLLTGTWLAASALTVVDAWLEGLTWPDIELRFARHFHAFTGVPMPPGFARVEFAAAGMSLYPAGYVLAAVRVAHWLEHLRALDGEAWWLSPQARAHIREMIGAGGTARFPDEWLEPRVFIRSCFS